MDPQNDEQVADLLGGLRRIDAPENFESRVRARLLSLAAEKSSFGFLKLAVPTAAFAGLGLFLFLSGYLGGEIPPVQVVSTTNETEKTRPVPLPEKGVVPNDSVPPALEYRSTETAETRPSTHVPQQPSLKDKKRSPGGGSYDIGAGDAVNARGIDSNSRPGPDANSEREMRRPSVLASDVLRYAGAVAEFRDSGWTVNSVGQSSVAERVGLKPGDVIVSLNDIRLGKATVLPSGVDLRIIRVRRNGNIIDLKF